MPRVFPICLGQLKSSRTHGKMGKSRAITTAVVMGFLLSHWNKYFIVKNKPLHQQQVKIGTDQKTGRYLS